MKMYLDRKSCEQFLPCMKCVFVMSGAFVKSVHCIRIWQSVCSSHVWLWGLPWKDPVRDSDCNHSRLRWCRPVLWNWLSCYGYYTAWHFWRPLQISCFVVRCFMSLIFAVAALWMLVLLVWIVTDIAYAKNSACCFLSVINK